MSKICILKMPVQLPAKIDLELTGVVDFFSEVWQVLEFASWQIWGCAFALSPSPVKPLPMSKGWLRGGVGEVLRSLREKTVLVKEGAQPAAFSLLEDVLPLPLVGWSCPRGVISAWGPPLSVRT